MYMIQEYIQICSYKVIIAGPCTLHWDGKILKKLNHVGDSEDRIAVLLDDGNSEILLGEWRLVYD